MASYNNYFPQSYANTLYGYNNMAPTQPISASGGTPNQLGAINWVQGEAGARSVPVAAGQKVIMLLAQRLLQYQEVVVSVLVLEQ